MPLGIERKVRCPLCDEGIIEVTFIPSVEKNNLTSTVGGNRSKTVYFSKSYYIAHNECSHCGASKEKIEKALKSDEEPKPSHENVLERMRKAGLPTRI